MNETNETDGQQREREKKTNCFRYLLHEPAEIIIYQFAGRKKATTTAQYRQNKRVGVGGSNAQKTAHAVHCLHVNGQVLCIFALRVMQICKYLPLN